MLSMAVIHKLFQIRGKTKALQAMLKHDSVETFRLLGQEWEVLQELFDKLQVIFYFFAWLSYSRNFMRQNQW